MRKLEKKIVNKHWQIILEIPQGQKKIRVHSERVYKICKEIYGKLPSTVVQQINKKMLYRAAFLHDIAKFDDNGIHNMIAGIIIKEYFNELDCDDFARLCSVIRCHRKRFDPDKNVIIEAAILRMADKIDKVRRNQKKVKKLKKACKVYKKNRKKVKRYLKEIKYPFRRELISACNACVKE